MPQRVEVIKKESMVGRLFLGGVLLGKILECLGSRRVSYAMYLGTNLAALGTGLLLGSKLVGKVRKTIQGQSARLAKSRSE
jgi:hypothetical protein